MNTLVREKQDLKYSNVDWCGNIPMDWRVEKIKSHFSLSKERASAEENEILSLTQKGIKVRDISGNEGQMAASYDNYAKLRKGDIVLNPMDLISGYVDLASQEGIISPAYTILRKKKTDLNLEYAKHFFQWHYIFNIFFPFGKGVSVDHRWTLGDDVLLNFPILIPPAKTQEKIADFLDEKTKKVDQIISKKKKLIELLLEKRVAIIAKAVTKGIDPNVKMIDSGVEWIGNMPKDWNIRKVKELFEIKRGRVIAKTELDPDGVYPVFSSQTANAGVLGMINAYDFDQDLLTWTTDGALAGTVFRRAGKFSCTNVCGMLIGRLNNKSNLNYMLYSVQHSALENRRPDTNGAKIMSGEMKAIKISCPPLNIQKQIADFLDKEANRIDQIIKKTQNQIKKLKEYHSSLIYNAVTGKIKI